MFGYLTPDINELKVKDYALFKAYYCGLCRVLKNEYNASAVLNYDAQFIYLLNDALNNPDALKLEKICCGLHPFSGREALIYDAADYAAAVNIMMAYYKLKDDIADCGSFKSKFMLLRFNKKYEKAAAKYPEPAEAAKEMWKNQQAAELNETRSTDEAAEPYAKLFGIVLKNISRLYECQLYDLGYALGRWVYLIDSYDDIEQDFKKGSYNVYIKKYDLTSKDEIPNDVKKKIENSFYYTLSRADNAFSAIDIIKNEPVLSNIVKLGLKHRTKAVLENIKEGTEDGSLPRFRRK